jgi:hypothetical protein
MTLEEMQEILPQHKIKEVHISWLKPHPKNYKKHPAEQIEHLKASIVEFGIFKPIVTANDHTILVGHGVTEACRQLGIEQIPIVATALDPNEDAAIKLMIADNETSLLGERDDRKFAELLKGVPVLKGTGYDQAMLADLLYITRPEHKQEGSFNAGEHWKGMPEFDSEDMQAFRTIKIHLADQQAVEDFAALLDQNITSETKYLWHPKLKKRWVKDLQYSDPDET